MNAADTNILFYAKDPRDKRKQQIAETLIQSLKDGVLLWQVACEYMAISRKLEPFGYNWQLAFKDLFYLQNLWKPVLPGWNVLTRAENLLNNYNLSTWDSLLVAACIENGVTNLYSEDIGNFFHAEKLEIINPFE